MPVPEFNEIKAPALQFFADAREHKVGEVNANLAEYFKLTEQEKNELLPSGTQRRWHNRVYWALYDLFRAGLLDRPKKGLYVITDPGKEIANQKPSVIDRDYLMQFPAFAEFMRQSGPKLGTGDGPAAAETGVPPAVKSETPEEAMGNAYKALSFNSEKGAS